MHKRLAELKEIYQRTEQRHNELMSLLNQSTIALAELRGAIGVLEELEKEETHAHTEHTA